MNISAILGCTLYSHNFYSNQQKVTSTSSG